MPNAAVGNTIIQALIAKAQMEQQNNPLANFLNQFNQGTRNNAKMNLQREIAKRQGDIQQQRVATLDAGEARMRDQFEAQQRRHALLQGDVSILQGGKAYEPGGVLPGITQDVSINPAGRTDIRTPQGFQMQQQQQANALAQKNLETGRADKKSELDRRYSLLQQEIGLAADRNDLEEIKAYHKIGQDLSRGLMTIQEADAAIKERKARTANIEADTAGKIALAPHQQEAAKWLAKAREAQAKERGGSLHAKSLDQAFKFLELRVKALDINEGLSQEQMDEILRSKTAEFMGQAEDEELMGMFFQLPREQQMEIMGGK